MRVNLMTPHEGQLNIYRNRGKQNVLRCGRRFGKTSMLETLAAQWAMSGDRVGWFTPNIKTFYENHEHLELALEPLIVSSAKTVNAHIKLRPTKGGRGKIDFWSLEDEKAGRGREYEHVIIDEASLIPNLENLYNKNIRPTLLISNGDTWMGGTPLGMTDQDFFWKVCSDATLKQHWKEHYAPCTANPQVTPENIAHYQATNLPQVFKQEYMAEWVNWSGISIFDEQKLLTNGLGIAPPLYCDYVFGVIDSAMKDGAEHDGTGLIICARNEMGGGPPITILDWDIVQITGYHLVDWMPSVFARMNEWAERCHAQLGSAGVWIEDKGSGTVLLQAGKEKGWPVNAIEGKATSIGKDARAMAASRFVHTEQVKITQHAHQRTQEFKQITKNHLMSQVTSFVVGDKAAAKRHDDLLDCFTYSCLVVLGTDEVF
ncbi:hypothetical protein [Paraburkholderia terrae]|uniref:hypothetical protein n=1 Tax=Paraburkholderia terrae TaxID=311230 RepID=UPI001EE22B5B|nr:hypothetical protein [Paraburkholderia terrae]GJH02271.1 hypothetical protein CBA19C8_16960 [Paraburkholderia terrae]